MYVNSTFLSFWKNLPKQCFFGWLMLGRFFQNDKTEREDTVEYSVT